ncbi:TIGR02206 family membrane protein [Streptococcus mutans]|uniref:YwaF family protein n=1 Tax=Streptococcus mutans TaxID=1309 RepID=UPI0002B53279|nr:TIGR02206 family membrane protein [Streptococcus mutans]EMB59768.1 hypothetical protein SMU21_09201 [Streptococcus mutans 1SM1]
MKAFLTPNQTHPPEISPLLYVLMIAVLLLLSYTSFKYYQSSLYTRTFKLIQAIQLLTLYSWYLFFAIPISNSLPFYHCRLAMFALLLLPDKTKLKQYFALMGVSGAIFAIGYPIMDAYTFPHITAFSFLIGHYALLVGSIIYLMRYYKSNFLSWKAIILYTFVLNLFLVIINYLTGGNYGILRYTPFITNTPLLVRYLAVTFILTAMLLLIDWVFIRREYGKARAER